MKKRLITTIIFISLCSTVVFLFGLGWVMKDQLVSAGAANAPVKPLKMPESKSSSQSKQIHIVALGDSLTRGTGDPEGKGYIGYMINDLKTKTKKPILLTNVAVKGATTANLLAQLKQPQIQREVKGADIVLFTIGGNDLFQGGNALTHLDTSYMKKIEKSYLVNLNSIYSEIRSINKQATVFHIGLYNPFNDLQQSKLTSSIVRQWNTDSANEAANYKEIVYVPTFDLFELHVNDYLFNDKFHPNTAGYKLIGERVASLITFSQEGNK
ncbi:SGNH/GDSL hydrolase family protein [Heyndrickxia acidicola]|uniref:SGNH/GDSL hydrolase family protein n=1 Tax=Heyndrickxia acidicola TaxID=209389 RepID=A0ABU6MEB4_9BACI|nr:SGNH/GDSL hydrolase family protein [Heyndrickxia acidicola]MED1203003.1 SGNH/GDSL hydrolase family protein [Heyndrickxia acidicola]